MRVIAGKCRSLPLKSLPGDNTRPTTDRIKETLFNILGPYIPGCRFLDLFSGSGAIGIEALSRGAKCACFVENNSNAVNVIKENLRFTKLGDEAFIIKGDALKLIDSGDLRYTYDVVFMDPPYNKKLETQALAVLKGSKWVHEDTLFVCEISLDTDIEHDLPKGYDIIKFKKYKTNAHVFIKKSAQTKEN